MAGRRIMILPLLTGILLVAYALSHAQTPGAAQRFQHNFFVMGTAATVLVEGKADMGGRFPRLMTELEERVRRVEKLMSRFDPQSDISRFNAARPGEMVAVNPLTWTALTEAMRVYTLSGGAFDVTVFPLLKLFDWKNTDATHFPDNAAITAAKAKTGMDKLIWERDGMQIGKTVPGVEIDLGGIAKGLGVDIAADFLRQNGIRDAVVDIGGEQRLLGQAPQRGQSIEHRLGAEAANFPSTGHTANVSRPDGAGKDEKKFQHDSGKRPWVTAIRAPRPEIPPAGKDAAPDNHSAPRKADDSKPMDTAAVHFAKILNIRQDCAVATSGDYEKYFIWKGKRYSHIFDPRQGLPLSGGVISATVIFPGACITADALATAVSVLGAEDSKKLLGYFPAAEAWLFLDGGGTVHIPAAAQTAKVSETAVNKAEPPQSR